MSVKPAKTKPSGVAWIGDIPDGWEVVPIRYYIDSFFSGVWGNEANVEQRTITCYRIADFDYARGILKSGPFTDRSYSESEIKGKLVLYGDLLLEKSGGGDSSPVGRVIFVNRNDCATCSNFIQQMRCRTLSEAKYLRYIFNALYSRRVNGLYYNQTIGIQNLKVSKYLSVKIPLPPLAEQRAIAAYLDDKCGAIDEAIVEAKKGIEEYKAWKKSLIFEVVTGKRRVGFFNAESRRRRVAEKMKPSGIPWIGDVPEGWKVMKLKYLIDVLPGYAFKSEGFDFSNGVRLLRGINVGVNSLKWDECVYWSSVINEELAAYQIQDGDLIIGLDRPWIADGTRVCFAKKEDLPCLLVQRVCRLRSLGGVILQIVNYWLSSEGFESALSCETTGVSVPHISPGQIMEFRIALPSLHEQRAIADCLDEKCASIDAMIAEKEALIADLEAYKKSLIYETVTGKREVRFGGYCD